MIPANSNDFLPTEDDVREARAREDKLHPEYRNKVAWFWRPLRGRYELRTMNNGRWVVLSR